MRGLTLISAGMLALLSSAGGLNAQAGSGLVYSYTPQGGNATGVSLNDAVAFPITQVGTTKTVNFTIMNRGASAATISSISVSGPAFEASGLPLPPFTLAANQSLQFGLSFTPKTSGLQTGQLVLSAGTATLAFTLQGTATAPGLVYQSSQGPFSAGQAITLPDTTVGQKTETSIQITNTGTADATISSINVVGAGFTLNNTPVLPLTLPQGGGQTQFSITFVPTAPGLVVGHVRVGQDTFDLRANAVGSALASTYSVSGSSSQLQNGGTISLPPVKVGKSTSASFTIANSGNAPAVINSIALSGHNSFTLPDLPALPLTLAPGSSSTFTVVFAPSAIGNEATSLQVGGQSFQVTASSTAPDPLPAIQLRGQNGVIAPQQQPSYTLSLAEPYAIDVTGTLTLDFNSQVFVDDPSIQFATGGRAIKFSIPAGTTQAVFSNNSTQIKLQTGSVAGAITLTASFATPGGVNLTPASAPTATLTIGELAPQITSVQIVSKTATTVTLQITGYATGRSVTQLSLQVTASGSASLSSTSLTVSVESAFQSWYATQESRQYGSAFAVLVPLTIQMQSSQIASPVSAISSVTVSLSNAQGTSPTQSIAVQ